MLLAPPHALIGKSSFADNCSVNISINGEPIDFELEGERTAGEIMAQLEALCEGAGMTIVLVKADGREIPEAELDGFFAADIASIGNLEIETISGDEILRMAGAAAADFARLSADLQDIPLLLQTGRGHDAMDTIARLSESLQVLARLLPLLSLASLPAEALQIDGLNPGEYLASVFPFVEEITQALESQDTVTIGDISEYEIAPRIEELSAFLSAIATHTSQNC